MSCYSTFTLADQSEAWRHAAGEYLLTRYQTQADGCWLWTGAVSGNGYGQAQVLRVSVAAHRLAYELVVGPVPSDLVLDHLCRVRACVNPEHLEPVTQAINIRRGLTGANNAAKTHCPADHPYTPENTYVIPKTGSRTCRTCQRQRRQEYDARVRERTG